MSEPITEPTTEPIAEISPPIPPPSVPSPPIPPPPPPPRKKQAMSDKQKEALAAARIKLKEKREAAKNSKPQKDQELETLKQKLNDAYERLKVFEEDDCLPRRGEGVPPRPLEDTKQSNKIKASTPPTTTPIAYTKPKPKLLEAFRRF